MDDKKKIEILVTAIKRANLNLKEYRVAQTRLDLEEALDSIKDD